MGYVENITDLIGRTPLYKLPNDRPEERADIFVKLEYFNAGGSVKDRIAVSLINAAEKSGQLKPGGTIIEATSGNTGVGIAMVAAARQYHLIIVLPDAVSQERKQLIKAYGGTVIETPAAEGVPGNLAKVEELLAEHPDYVSLRQFANAANPAAHRRTTGPEIVADLGHAPDAFVAGIGTGGTITGTGCYLREQKPDIKIYAVEPAESQVLAGGEHHPHPIQGIGAGIVPEVLDQSVYDDIIHISGEEAFAESRLLAKSLGLLLGASSGAAIRAAKAVAEKLGAGRQVVVMAPDNGERYLSTELFAE